MADIELKFAADKIVPLCDRVLLEREEPEERTAGGILLPESSRDAPSIGTVVAVGEGEYRDNHLVPIKLKKGQKVLMPKYVGMQFKINKKSYVIVKYSELIAELG
jgi:chaperonin GroES